MVNCDDACTPDQWPWECDCDAPDVGRMDDFEWPPIIVVIVGVSRVIKLLTNCVYRLGAAHRLRRLFADNSWSSCEVMDKFLRILRVMCLGQDFGENNDRTLLLLCNAM
jgi:hypothetical protein